MSKRNTRNTEVPPKCSIKERTKALRVITDPIKTRYGLLKPNKKKGSTCGDTGRKLGKKKPGNGHLSVAR